MVTAAEMIAQGFVQVDGAERISSTLGKMREQGTAYALITGDNIKVFSPRAQTEKHDDIQYVGLEELDINNFQKAHVRRFVSRHADKLERYFHNEHQLIVHIKEYAREGKRHKYSVHLRLSYPGATVPSCHADAWDIRTAVQDAFSRLITQLERQYKSKEVISERKTGREMPA